MADVKLAVMAVIRQEDETLSGRITQIKGDTGGRTRFGLAEAFHPELTGTTYYTTMDTADALQVAVNTMTAHYAEPLRIGEIVDQALANKVLSYGVSEWIVRATQALQLALNVLLPTSHIAVDGEMAPLTIATVNRCMPVSLLLAFKVQMIERYAVYAKDNVLRGLINRALA